MVKAGSSHQHCSLKKGFLSNSAIFTGKHLCWSLFLLEKWWRRTTVTLLGVSFGSYRRRRRDVLMGHCGYVPLRHSRVFRLRPTEMSWRRADGASSLRPLETSSRHTNKMSWRRTTETLLGVSFERYLRRRWVHVSTVFFLDIPFNLYFIINRSLSIIFLFFLRWYAHFSWYIIWNFCFYRCFWLAWGILWYSSCDAFSNLFSNIINN